MYKIPVSNGELIDKITILSIKLKKIKDVNKLDNINNELTELNPFLSELKSEYKDELNNLITELEDINLELWEVEDKIREKERKKMFDDEFISLARKVYYKNDTRSIIKLKINKLTNSYLIEEKSYDKYNL
jgi:predicted RNase H-like nuclease (RuvC/YqgF family)